jgi:hypothetical protein
MNKYLQGMIAVTVGLIVVASGGVLLYRATNMPAMSEAGYLSDKRIPSIVEGSAKMVETERYFESHDLTTATAKLDLHCNNSNKLELTLGYKESSYELQDTSNPTKEVTLWSRKNLFTQASEQSSIFAPATVVKTDRLALQWDLLQTGFSKEEYVKADERVWYLKITDMSDGPYGYERNTTVMHEGKAYTVPDFVPKMNYLDTFQLAFNGLVFETLFHPFFDGSTEIVVPIRGVQHELSVRNVKLKQEITGYGKINSWSTTQGSSPYGALWAVVFATQVYDNLFDGELPDMRANVMAARTFIKGTHGSDSRHPNGLIDYGWRVAYCMDGYMGSTTDLKTVSKTDESHLKSMLSYADGQLGSLGRLIVFVHSHGHRYNGPFGGNHVTLTTNSHYILPFWTNVMTTNNYYDYIEDITDDGTHVFLWVDCCHGNGLGSWSSSDHHNCLEIWYYIDYGYAQGPDDGYYWSSWDFYHTDWPFTGSKDSEGERFFLGAEEGACQRTISSLGYEIKYWFNIWLHNGESTMHVKSYWGDHIFYINWG